MSPIRTLSMAVRYFMAPIFVHIFPPITFSKKDDLQSLRPSIPYRRESNSHRIQLLQGLYDLDIITDDMLLCHLFMQHHKLHVGLNND